MVDFRPFRGIRYQTSIAGPLDDLICPPYDVISPAQEQRLLERSAYNMVRLELAELAGTPSPDRYTLSAQHYRHWLETGILGRDETPCYYLLRQRFSDGPEAVERYSLIGALQLEEWGRGVLPHEQTGTAAKADRLELMEATTANFSPLMGLFSDDSGLMRHLQGRAATSRPDGQAKSDDGQECTLWRIASQDLTTHVGQTLAQQSVYMADGHHRYETALSYYRKRRQEQGGNAPAASSSVMMGLIATDDPGLRILPYHRVVGHLPPELFAQIRDRIAQLFITQPVGVDISTPEPLEGLVAQEGRGGPAIGLMGPRGEGPYLLTLGNHALAGRYIPSDREDALREVEAWLLQEVVLRPVLGDSFADYVAYTHEGAQALAMLESGSAQLAFFLKGLPPSLFERLVGAGVRLPRKSTYFHPKLPSGFVIKSLEGSPQP